MQLLVERDDVVADSKDIYGRTPLSRAALAVRMAVVRLLVMRDDVAVDSEDNWGQTPLSRAARQGHKTVMKLLMSKHPQISN